MSKPYLAKARKKDGKYNVYIDGEIVVVKDRKAADAMLAKAKGEPVTESKATIAKTEAAIEKAKSDSGK